VDVSTGETLLRGAAFVRQESRNPPKWYGLIHALTEEALPNRLQGSIHSGIVLADASGAIWALSFGHSHRDVEELGVQARFGRIAISNAIDDTDALRGFVAQTFGRNAKVRIEATNRDGPMDRLSFLEQSNRLKRLRARIDFDGEELTVEGGSGLKFPRAENADQLVQILDQLASWWNGGCELRSEIAEKDPVLEIVEQKRIDSYEVGYEAALASGSTDGFFISLDLAELWTAQGYALKIGRDRICELAVPDTEVIVQQARLYLNQETDLHKLRLEFDLETGSQVRKVRDVLSFERPQAPGEPFVVVRDEGRWWEYRSNWVDKIQTTHERYLDGCRTKTKNLEPLLAKFKRGDYKTADPEGKWLIEQAKSIQGAAVLHKTSNLRIPGARSPVELADLFIPASTLLSVKRGADLKRIDEVATQMEAAARMLVREPDYSLLCIELCHKLGLKIDFANRSSITLGCVTISYRPSLSIRAKERINQFFRTMHDFNFQPVWVFVDASP
jgi:uncharacterized protein (TIGR04141 family)